MAQSNITVDDVSATLGTPDIARTLNISMLSLHNNGDKKIYVWLDQVAVANQGLVIMPWESKSIMKWLPTFGLSVSFPSIPDLYFVCKSWESSSLAIRYM